MASARGKSKRSESATPKRKREHSEVHDLSDIKTDQEAREYQSPTKASPAFRQVSSNRPDSKPQSSSKAQKRRSTEIIDLDQVPDRPASQTIEIDADEEESGLVNIDEFSLHQYIGSFFTKIVGVQHYRGRATTGESVNMRREPRNAYDKNAIQCLNVNSQQIGHIPAQIAAGLAPWLDNKVCIVEGSVKAKAQVYSIPLRVDVFAHGAIAAQLPQALARAGMQLDDKSRSANGPVAGTATSLPSIEEIRAGQTTVNTRSATAMLDDLTVNVKDLQKMKKAKQPSRLATQLLDYQLQGLHWMIEKENPSVPEGKEIVQLWTRKGQDAAYYNLASHFTSDSPPKLGRGGLLADDMGLGKTLQMLSLIVSDQHSAPGLNLSDDAAAKGPTLVICPASLISNWTDQAQEHFRGDQALDIDRYHGASRSDSRTLTQKELVVSTYGVLTSEYKSLLKSKSKKTKDGLFSVNWARIILDEAHKIRNPKSQASLAVDELKGERRWCITGTPVVNTYNDLGAILRFVKWTGGLNDPSIFNSKITRNLLAPGETVRKEAVKLVKILMTELALRRRKDMELNGKRLIDLPKFTEYIHRVKFESEAERETYSKLENQAKGILRTSSQQPSQVLEILLRMRQVCCAVSLISQDRLDMLEKLESMTTVEFTQENRLALQDLLALAVEASEECPICIDSLVDAQKVPAITYCKHVFCKDCILSAIAEKESCPLCRAALKDSQILELPAVELPPEDNQFSNDSASGPTPSTKINALMKILNATQAQDSTNKTVVFSQWTKLLDVIQHTLQDSGISFCRIDGTMSLPARDSAIKQLQSGTCSVMLASLAVASVGLNLTSANSVILMDPWWSPAIEDQCVDRVFRLGQKRPVTVYKMVIEGSVEEKVLEIQERKRKMTATVGTGQSRSQQAQSRRDDMNALLSGSS